MDPRHKLYKTLDKLTVDSETANTMSATTNDVAMQDAASSGVTPDAIKRKLETELGATWVEIEDMSGGCGQMFEAIIVSPHFTKKTTLARHRLVNSTLKEEIAAIHAWTPKCHTPEEWEKKRPQ
ncbi:bola domain-containing protein [Cucurbitaria berberidis CBS 394.84]|uniref:Bola domain-containing protein n=1 Tax=Cucurbitaria berberidis CBS 394.84 TaxID=1168544 RepID=A0A9P4GMW5_9PLEO|nr:bola domain-containing protein [Cucurbitaria berberidis CBS 394.84]KAF1848490.1 bola domain-containing protein [Cucurbitaria berberidis CBS 394.84]